MLLRWAKISFFSFLSVLLIASSVSYQSALAFEAQPLVHTLNPTGMTSRSQLQIRNPTSKPLTVELSAYRLTNDSDGITLGDSAEDSLLVFPVAAVIQPYQTQIVRMQWAGSPVIETDQSFVVAIEQLPINVSGKEADSIKMLLTFNAVVHVVSSRSTPDLSAELVVDVYNAKADTGKKSEVFGTALMKLRLLNSGTGNAFGSNMTIVLKAYGHEYVIDSAILIKYNDNLFIPPGGERVIEVPTPVAAVQDPDEIKISIFYVSSKD